MFSKQSNVNQAILLLGGFIFGMYLGIFVRQNRCQLNLVRSLRPRTVAGELGSRELIIIGVMTAEKFLDTRADAVFETWGRSVPGKLKFFCSDSSFNQVKLPVVSLPGVDDSYPPMKKSLMMLKYLHDHYIDQYQWFMRADDDVYVKTDKLAKFLQSLNSSEDIYLGHAGVGATEEKDELKLGDGGNYCIGGPGVVLSRSVLKKVVPHLEYCIQNAVSSHEDVELGRCIRRFVGIGCTLANEMRTLFFHHYTAKESVFFGELNTKAIRQAITLHPIKKPRFMYRLHSHFMAMSIQDLHYKSSKLQETLKKMDQLVNLNQKLPPKEKANLLKTQDLSWQLGENYSKPWNMFARDNLYGNTEQSQTYTKAIGPSKVELDFLKEEMATLIDKESNPDLQQCFKLKEVTYAYTRVLPLYGAQYLVKASSMQCQQRRRRTKHAATVNEYLVRVQQPFGSLIHQAQPLAEMDPTVHFIVPLQGRLETFRRFMGNFEEVCLKRRERVKLTIAIFQQGSAPSEHRAIMKEYEAKYPEADLYWLEFSGNFSRGIALTVAAQQFDRTSLLFLCDVDLIFNAEFVHRCRANTVFGEQVYFPIMFSLFNPEATYPGKGEPQTVFTINKETGYWRYYSFGPVCVYYNDFEAVGGFNTSIKGWGLEDVDLNERFIKHDQIRMFRAPDPGLIHVYHPVNCDPRLNAVQYASCLGSKAFGFASQKSLVRDLLSRAEPLPGSMQEGP